MTNIENITASVLADAKRYPFSYWAKRLDSVVHIPAGMTGGVLCGRYGARLGNNYAPDLMAGDDPKICPACIQRKAEAIEAASMAH